MRRWMVLVLVCAACVGQPAALPDARIDAPIVGLTVCGVNQIISCRDSMASVSFGFFHEQMSGHPCDPPATTGGGSVFCAQGCALEFTQAGYYQREALIEPAALCAETPDAQIGDACGSAVFKCLPSRAQLNPDGTVAGRDQLTCGANNQCEAGVPPFWDDYLDACDQGMVSAVAPGSNGALTFGGWMAPRACLLAWDETSKTMHSGVTRQCLGDWQCPALALCDTVPNLSSPTDQPLAVCKPGPRGTLTPAMLPN